MAHSDPITFRDYAVFLRRYLKGRQHLVLVLAVILFINIGLQIYNPQILRRFIDAATSGQPVEQLIWMGLTFIAIAFSHQLINVAGGLCHREPGLGYYQRPAPGPGPAYPGIGYVFPHRSYPW